MSLSNLKLMVMEIPMKTLLNKVYVVDFIVSATSEPLVEMGDAYTFIYKLLPEDDIHFKEQVPRDYVLVNHKFKRMPFSTRALNEIGISDIKPLLEDGMLQSYSTLRVKDDIHVAHVKFTMYVTNKGARNMTHNKFQKFSWQKEGTKDGKQSLVYCGKIPLAHNGSGCIPIVNDVSWNLHNKLKKQKEKVLACTGTFGTYVYSRSNGITGAVENLEEGWNQVQLYNITGTLCEWCPVEGNILAIGAVDPETEKGSIYLVDYSKPGAAPVSPFKNHTGVGFNSLSWSNDGAHLLATFSCTNAFTVLNRTLRSLRVYPSYIRFQPSQDDKADFYGVFHPTMCVVFVASSDGCLKAFGFDEGQKGSADGWYWKNTMAKMHLKSESTQIGCCGISIHPNGDMLTCARSDGNILVVEVKCETIGTGGSIFSKICLVQRQGSLPNININWIKSNILATVNKMELITLYGFFRESKIALSNQEPKFQLSCDNKMDVDCTKRCHKLNTMDWHRHQDGLLALSSEDGFVHFWVISPSKSAEKYQPKVRNIFSEKMFYIKPQIQYGLGETLAQRYKKLQDDLNEISSSSSTTINLLEGKIQKATSLAMDRLKMVERGTLLSQADTRKFLEDLLVVLTTENREE